MNRDPPLMRKRSAVPRAPVRATPFVMLNIVSSGLHRKGTDSIMSRRGPREGAAWLVLVLLMLVGLAAFTTPAAAVSLAANDPKVSDGVTTLQYSHLNAGTSRISGLRDNVVTAKYTGATGPPPEVLGCNDQAPSVLRYTLNGTLPTGSSPSVALTCTDPAGPAPNASHSYRGVLPASILRNAGSNALVTFRMEIARVGSTPFIDNNGGAFYKYRMDISRGQFTSRAPAPLAGSSIADAVTPEQRPIVSFRVQDHPAESPINESRVQIRLEGTVQTGLFDCFHEAAGFAFECNLNYDLLVQDFKFSEGSHAVVVEGFDLTSNAFNAANSTLNFRVDKTAPTVRNVTAVPNVFVSGATGHPPITARGAFVTVRATVDDPNINTNGDNAVAILFNTTEGVRSDPALLDFNATSGRWESKVVQVPLMWPEKAFNVSVEVIGVDQAANAGVGASANPQFQLDPKLPVIEETPPGPFVRDVPTLITAKVTDNESGVDPAKVLIEYSNITGRFKTEPAGVLKIDNRTFRANMTRQGTTDDYTYTLPAAEGASVIVYSISASDRAGGPAQGPARTLVVDVTGPVLVEVGPRAFRAQPPHEFRFTAIDAGAGVDNATGRLFFATTGGFQSQDLVFDAAANQFRTNVTASVPDGGQIKYHVEVLDKLGNPGRLHNASNPGLLTIDLVPPVVSDVTAPASASTERFTLSWSGTDARSGIDHYTVEARVNDGTPTEWIAVANATRDTSFEFCGEGGHTYEFRVTATDRAGNTAALPTEPQAATELTGAGCKEEAVVSVIAPAAGTVLNANSTPAYEVRWSASSTRSFTPSSGLRIDVEFSPDGGKYWHMAASGLANTGSYSLDLSALPSCTSCQVRVTAQTLTGASAQGLSGPFRIVQGAADADLDANGLPDPWEIRYFGGVGLGEAEGDSDGDGLSDREEAQLGTDPLNSDTDGDGVSDRTESRVGTSPLDAADTPSDVEAREEQYTHWYWSVPAVFLVVAILFFIGLARRW